MSGSEPTTLCGKASNPKGASLQLPEHSNTRVDQNYKPFQPAYFRRRHLTSLPTSLWWNAQPKLRSRITYDLFHLPSVSYLSNWMPYYFPNTTLKLFFILFAVPFACSPHVFVDGPIFIFIQNFSRLMCTAHTHLLPVSFLKPSIPNGLSCLWIPTNSFHIFDTQLLLWCVLLFCLKAKLLPCETYASMSALFYQTPWRPHKSVLNTAWCPW